MTVKSKYICKFLLFLWLSIVFPHEAYSFCYTSSSILYEPLPTTPPSGSTTLNLLDDSYSQIINIGFTFNFFGINYNQLLIGSNGLVSFDLSQAGTSGFFFILNGPNPNPNNPTNTIMFPWQDTNPSQGGTIFYYTMGTAPNREFVVVFNQVPAFACPSQLQTQGLILYETTNDIDIVIGNKTICTVQNGLAIEGIQNASGTNAYSVIGRNGTQWATTNDSYRFSPLSSELGLISGPTNPCVGSSQNYSIGAVLDATSYIWNVPADWMITTDAGTFITVTVGNMSGNVSVTANDACGSSNPQVLAVTVNTIPNQPGAISGPTNPCVGSSQNYSIGAVLGATSYTWNVPDDWMITTSVGSSITVTVGNTSGNVSVTANNACGSSNPQVLAITVNAIPNQPGAISGPINLCVGSSQNYSIGAVLGATSYTWNVPADWAITTDAGTSIIVTVGNTSGNVSVTANNACGISDPRLLAVTVNTVPNQPGAISGFTNPCVGSSQNYSIGAVLGATSYTWSVPADWAITTDAGTSIIVTVGNMNGNVSVIANNACGSSNPQVLAITVNAIPNQPGAISGPTNLCVGSSQNYSIGAVLGATSYTWSVPADWAITTDAGTFITVTVGNTSGNVSVTANNACGSSSSQALSVKVDSIPILGNIIGPDTVNLSQTVTYSVPFVNGITYTWSYSGSGVKIASFGNQVIMTFGPEATGGTLAVSVTNHCEISPLSTLLVSIEILPPSQINGRKIANRFVIQTEYVNVIRWSASSSPGVKSYRIYRNDVLIEEIKASHHEFKDHNRSINQSDFYAVTSVGTNSQESEPITISIR